MEAPDEEGQYPMGHEKPFADKQIFLLGILPPPPRTPTNLFDRIQRRHFGDLFHRPSPPKRAMDRLQFLCFPRLPKELRAMVWTASIEPRVVEVNMVHDPRPRAGRSKISWRTTHNPAQLEVSLEAREVLLRLYRRLCCACPVAVGGAVTAPQAIVYCHPDVDVLSQDFEAIIQGSTGDRVRRPGVNARLTLTNGFGDILPPLRPAPRDVVDHICVLRHIQLDLHILKSSRRNQADNRLQTTTNFIHGLLNRWNGTALQTITVRITKDLSPSPTPATRQNLRTMVYRIVRSPSLPAPKGCFFFTAIHGLMDICEARGKSPGRPRFRGILLTNGALFTRPRPQNGFAALRVVDPADIESYYDDDGGS
jgi:hypothetical protein